MTPQPEPAEVLQLFRSTGTYLSGHFGLTSGLHRAEYVQCALVLQRPRHAGELGRSLAARITSLTGTQPIRVVASPAIGGLIIGHEVARALGARFIFTERDPLGKMTLRRGFAVTPGETTVVVEDVVTTGGSTRAVVEIRRREGASPMAGAAIIDRSGCTADVGLPRVALATLNVVAHEPDACPLCAQGIPVAKPGSRPA